ncbi:hypothetical protein J2741_000619 [Methanolinea mesophila]|uniref:DUF4350 domain-containing protein n=1 Tax=Methanolinea mesophila TaxID=547055 RepID=UPI001AE70FD6|nr:DUF4350 domain-containing protein [Methanolinea mesophila]MBP1928072.1 hypothetical protein [Methanolinea mesophila]
MSIRSYWWIAGAVLAGAVILVAFQFSTTNLEYSRYNPGWNGTSAFAGMIEAHGGTDLYSASELSGKQGSMLLIIAPRGDLTQDERTKYREYLNRGNLLLLADDRGESNGILSALGSTLRVSAVNVSSADREYNDPSSVDAYPAGEDPLVKGLQTICLNRPAVVRGGSPMLETSLLTWVDENGNGRLDGGEALSRSTIMSSETLGNGTIYVLADPSIFINGMLDPPACEGNHALVERILTAAPGGVMIDQVHGMTGSEDGAIGLINIMKSTTLIRAVALLLTVLGVMAIYRTIKKRGGS